MFEFKTSNRDAIEELFVDRALFVEVIELASDELLFITSDESVSILTANDELFEDIVPYSDEISAAVDDDTDVTV